MLYNPIEAFHLNLYVLVYLRRYGESIVDHFHFSSENEILLTFFPSKKFSTQGWGT